MRNLLFIPLLMLLAGCETTEPAKNAIPKQTPTGILFNTSDVLYTGGLGEAGIDGFCRRIGNKVADKFHEIGIAAVSNAPPTPEQARINVTFSTIETKSGASIDFLRGVYGAMKVHVKYSAQLDSPAGATLATWKHDVEEESIDRLTDHIASDIVKYLKAGFK